MASLGQGQKGEKDELCSERLQTTIFCSRSAGKPLNPLFAGTFNDRALQAAVITACPLVTGQFPLQCTEPLGHFTRPEDSCPYKRSIQKTTCEDEQTKHVGRGEKQPM